MHSVLQPGGVPTVRSPRAAPISPLSPKPNPWVCFSICETHIPTAFYAPRVLHDLAVLSSYSSWRQKSAKTMKFTVPYLPGGAGRGVDGLWKGGGGLLGIGLGLSTKQAIFQPFKAVFKWSQGRA